MRCIVAVLASAGARGAADWTEPVEVRHQSKRAVSYRARLAGDYLLVQATHEPGWHTYAMDIKQRANEKLAGRQSLGVEEPTEIKLTDGLTIAGPWHQSPPKDMSKPELLWFTWGFEGQSLFAAKIRRSGAGPARVAITGQACTEAICKQVDVAITLPLTVPTTASPDIDLKSLIRVR